MKYLLMPGLPLLVITLSLHDADSPAAVCTYLVALFILIVGSIFIIFYALCRTIS